MDYGYHNTLGRAMMMHLSAEENMVRSRQGCMDLLSKSISDLDQRSDKQRFLELNNQSFSLPKKFEFQPHKGDEVSEGVLVVKLFLDGFFKTIFIFMT